VSTGGRYSLAVMGAGLAVAGLGWLATPEWRTGVWLGAAVGVVTQVAVFWTMFVWLFPERRLLAHGLGMISRLTVFAMVALLVLSGPTGPAAATLFALVAVFFVSTVLEPVFLRTEPLKRI
jgi:hypothetical protein